MKNTLEDLNNHLFAALERLNDEELTGEELEKEISRSKAINGVASQIISNAQLALSATELQLEYGVGRKEIDLPKMLEKKDA